MRDYYILGSKVTDLTLDELLGEMDRQVERGLPDVILNTNVHGIMLARRHAWLRRYRNRTPICHCDGAGVVMGARLLGLPVSPRLSMNDFVWAFGDHCRQRSYKIFLLGAKPEMIRASAEEFERRCPGLQIVGHRHGYFDKDGAETQAVIDEVNASGADILLLGLGMPIQERWLHDHGHKLTVPCTMVVGGLFKRMSGHIPFAPAWISKLGLEWAYLSMADPKRFFGRYMIENPKFLGLVLLQRLGMVRAREPAEVSSQG